MSGPPGTAPGIVLRDAQGHPIRAVGTTQNIDEPKRSEDAIRQSEQWLAAGACES